MSSDTGKQIMPFIRMRGLLSIHYRLEQIGRVVPAAARKIPSFLFLRQLILFSSIFRSAWKNQKLYAVMQCRIISASGSAARFQSDCFMGRQNVTGAQSAGKESISRNRRQAGWIAAADRENH